MLGSHFIPVGDKQGQQRGRGRVVALDGSVSGNEARTQVLSSRPSCWVTPAQGPKTRPACILGSRTGDMCGRTASYDLAFSAPKEKHSFVYKVYFPPKLRNYVK